MAEQINLGVDFTQIKKEVDALKLSLEGLGKSGKVAFKEVETAANAASADIQQAFDVGAAEGVVDVLNEMQKEFKQMEAAANTLRGALSRATDPDAIKLYAKNIADLEKGMSDLEKAAKAGGVQLKEFSKSTSLAKDVAGELFGQLGKAALIAAAIGYIKDFAKEAINLASQTEKATKQFTAFLGSADKAQKTVDALRKTAAKNILPTKDVLDAGKALLAFGESANNLPTVLTRIANISRATGKDFNELTSIYGKARTAGVLYAEDINQLLDAGINILPLFAEQLGVSVDQVKKLGSEGKIGFAELELAFAKLTAEGGTFAGQAQAAADASDRFSVAWESALTAVGQFIKPVTDAFINLGASALESLKPLESGDVFGVIKTQAAQLYAFISGNKGEQVGSFFDVKGEETKSKEIIELEKKAAAERAKLASKNAKENAAKAAQYERERRQAIIDAMAEGEAKDLAIENQRFQALTKELQKFHLSTENAEQAHRVKVAEIRFKYASEALIEQAKQQADELELLQRGLDEAAALDKENKDNRAAQDAANKEVRTNALKLSLATFELEQQTERNIFFSKKRTTKEVQDFEKAAAKERELFQLQQNQKEIENQLAFGSQLSDVQKAIIEEQLALVKKRIEGVSAGGDNKPKDNPLLKLLGIDPNDPETEKALKDAFNLVKNSVDQLLGEQIRLKEAEEQAAADRVATLEDRLAKEKKLRDEGFANEYEQTQKQLADAKAAQAKATEDKRRAQRAAILIDTATQVSNTAVAISNIIRDYSTIPFVGILLGFAQVAALFASLSAAKAKAKAINQPQFRHGGEVGIDGNNILVGPSHERGGIGIEAEGGEAVFSDGRKLAIVSKKMTRKHFGLVAAINADDRPRMYEYVRGMIEARDEIVLPGSARERGIISTAKIEQLQGQTVATAKKIEQNTRPTEQWVDMGTHWRVTKGNVTKTIRKHGKA